MKSRKTTLPASLLLFMLTNARAGEEAAIGEKKTLGCTWKVRAEYPELGIPSVDGAIRDWLKGHVSSCMDSAKEYAEPGDSGAAWDMVVAYDVNRRVPGVVGVTFDCYDYLRGADHPLGSIAILNFSLADGRLLGLDDLFQHPDKALAIFAEHSKRLVIEGYRRQDPEESEEDLKDACWIEEGFEASRRNFSCLGLEPDGVRVSFQQYQILPYVYGTPTAFFPLELLAPARPSAGIWPRGT